MKNPPEKHADNPHIGEPDASFGPPWFVSYLTASIIVPGCGGSPTIRIWPPASEQERGELIAEARRLLRSSPPLRDEVDSCRMLAAAAVILWLDADACASEYGPDSACGAMRWLYEALHLAETGEQIDETCEQMVWCVLGPPPKGATARFGRTY